MMEIITLNLFSHIVKLFGIDMIVLFGYIILCLTVLVLLIKLRKANNSSKYWHGRFSHDASLLSMTRKWLEIEQNGYSICDWFTKNNIHTVLIYGAGELGKRLILELDKKGIAVIGVIDRKPIYYFYGAEGFFLQDNLPKADIVVVTVPEMLTGVRNRIKNDNTIAVKNLADILHEYNESCNDEGNQAYSDGTDRT